METRTETDGLVLYLKGNGALPGPLQVQIGTVPVGEAQIQRLSELPGHRIHTYILIDNSLSITAENRAAAASLLQNLFLRHPEGEEFSVYTYGTTLQMVCEEEEDPQTLSGSIDSLVYENQSSYFKTSLQELLGRIRDRKEQVYTRLLVICDGADDTEYGPTESELLEQLREDKIPIYALGSRWEQDTSGLAFLFTLARKTGGAGWMLDDLEEHTDVTEILNQDAQMLVCQVPVVPPLRDGSRKMVSGSAGDLSFSEEVQLPLISAADLELWEQSQTEQAQTEMEEVIIPEAETETESEPSEELMPLLQETEARRQARTLVLGGRIRIPLILIPVLAGLLVSGAVLAAFMIYQKKRPEEEEKGWEEDPSRPSGNAYAQYYEETRTELIRPEGTEDEEEHTRLLWKEDNNRLIRLIDLTEPGRNYPVPVMKQILIGRSVTACEVSFPDDTAVSAKHCCIREEEGVLILEDLGSSNGTYLNGERVRTQVKLEDGDILKIGMKELRVTIEKER